VKTFGARGSNVLDAGEGGWAVNEVEADARIWPVGKGGARVAGDRETDQCFVKALDRSRRLEFERNVGGAVIWISGTLCFAARVEPMECL